MPSNTALTLRIDQLSQDLEAAKKQRANLDEQIARIQGRLDELWDWKRAEETKEKFQLPTFGDQEKLEEAIEQRGKAVYGIGVEEAKQLRTERYRKDGQSAVDEMDGMPDGPTAPA